MNKTEVIVVLKVELVYYDDLSEKEKETQPDNGCGKEYARYIKISNAGQTLMILSDAIEPEDATFNRDLRSVIDAVKLAYVQGIKDGKKLRR
ncbi:hypothetical protein [Caldifermentibacillus hisashii]|uniref:hypothetical protein n=1 Tax=Caldifermentibacillus hisashii TaxID=996558 RepID=UPI0030F3721D